MRRWSLLLAVLVASCAGIADLDDGRKLALVDSGTTPVGNGDDGGVDDVDDSGIKYAAGCKKFCADVQTLCTADRMVQDYSTPETCAAVCAKFSTDPAVTGNTLACRQEQLNRLASAGPTEAQTYCPAASPGGGPGPGEPAGSGCGTNCVGFCALRAATCPPEQIEPDCVNKCQALPDYGPYNADKNYGSGQDSLECRIAHLSAAVLFESEGRLDDRNNHCMHSGIRSLTQCDVSGTATIMCPDYCKVVDTACANDSAVFESDAQCQAFCAKMPSGTISDDKTLGTVRCARAGAYNALLLGPSQCVNAGPAPDTCGTGRCQGYCALAAQGCAPQFALAYPGGQADCTAKCQTLSGASQNDPYSVTAAVAKNGNTLQCRLLRITRVLAGDMNPATCAEALGGGACQ